MRNRIWYDESLNEGLSGSQNPDRIINFKDVIFPLNHLIYYMSGKLLPYLFSTKIKIKLKNPQNKSQGNFLLLKLNRRKKRFYFLILLDR